MNTTRTWSSSTQGPPASTRATPALTMTAQDVAEVVRHASGASIIAVHMEAINHCLLGRDELRSGLVEAGASEKVTIPADGESLAF